MMPDVYDLQEELVLNEEAYRDPRGALRMRDHWKGALCRAIASDFDAHSNVFSITENSIVVQSHGGMASPTQSGSPMQLVVDDVKRRYHEANQASSISVVDIGRNTIYPLKVPHAFYFNAHTGEFLVPSLDPSIVGRGETISSAKKHWEEQLHFTFQQLERKASFEMTDAEKEQKARLRDHIDVTAHYENSPLIFRRIGRVTGFDPPTIQWQNQETVEVSLGSVPPALAGVNVGQWFEATVSYNRRTDQLHEILDFGLLPDPMPESGVEDDGSASIEPWKPDTGSWSEI